MNKRKGHTSQNAAAVVDIGDLPKDESLPGLATLLDAQRMPTVLSSRLRGDLRPLSCRVNHVRYKPATSCVASYELEAEVRGTPQTLVAYGKCYARENFTTAVAKARTHNIDTGPLPPMIELPESSIILYLFPNDAEMRGLRLVGQNKRMQRIIYEHHEPYRPREWRVSDRRMTYEILRYKPEKRALIRVSTRAVHRKTQERLPLSFYLRVYADDRGGRIADVMETVRRANRSLPVATPTPLVYLKSQHILLIDHLQGVPLIDELLPNGSTETITATARSLAALHGIHVRDLERRSPEALAGDIDATALTIARVAPELEHDVGALVSSWRDRFLKLPADDAGFVHGDFYHGQVLVDGNNIGIIDFDRSYSGDPVADVANFCAHMRCQQLAGRTTHADRISSEFVEAYQREMGRTIDFHALQLYTFLGMFQLAVAPFRSLQRRWKTRMAEMLKTCEELLK